VTQSPAYDSWNKKAGLAAAKARWVKLGNPALRAGKPSYVAKARQAQADNADETPRVSLVVASIGRQPKGYEAMK
jgi:hypothetical protein